MEVERRGEQEVPGQFVVLDHYLCTYMYLSFEHLILFARLLASAFVVGFLGSERSDLTLRHPPPQVRRQIVLHYY